MQIDIIGVPIDLGADRRGVDMGPSAIRYAHLHQKLRDVGYTLEDKGNIEVPIQETCRSPIPSSNISIASFRWDGVWRARWPPPFRAGVFRWCWAAITACRLGSIRGAANIRSSGVIWVDAHADFNTAETTPSGNIHGMPLAALCGLGDPRLVSLWEEDASGHGPEAGRRDRSA